MNPFNAPPTVSELAPIRTMEKAKSIRKKLREAGLLAEDCDPDLWRDCREDAEYLLACLRSRQPIGFSTAKWRNIGNIIGWVYENGETVDNQLVSQAVLNDKLRLNEEAWCVLLSIHFSDDEMVQHMRKHSLNWRNKNTKKLVRFFGDLQQTNFSNLPDILVNRVTSSEATLNSVARHVSMVPALRLYQTVWKKLHSMEAEQWVNAHTGDDIQQYLESHQQTDTACRVTRQLLEPKFKNGLTSAGVRPGQPVSDIVQMVINKISINDRTRKIIGEPALTVIRWWKVQRDLEEFFLAFGLQAMREREVFWRQYVQQIEDIRAFPRASALGMFINGYWYIEFGKINNACWRYSENQFKRLMASTLIINEENDLKAHPRDWKGHTANYKTWYKSFPIWIGVKPLNDWRNSR